MTLQVAEKTTTGKVHTSTTRSNSITPQETAEVECILQQYSSPKLYCYPRVRAHSTLLVCFRTLESVGSVWPQRILRNSITLNKRVITAVKRDGVRGIEKSNHTTKKNKPSVDVQLTQCLYPGSEMVLVSDSTVSMMDALLRHLCISQGTTIFLPGILLHPYFNLLQLFDQWMLRVVGYDVDTVTMFADENDIRKKAVKLGLLTKTNKKKETNSHREYRSIVLLIGIGGRFLMNTKRMVEFARRELQAITVELHPVKAITLMPSEDNKGSGMNMYADMHITSMDTAGEIGGAVAFTPDPLLAQGIFTQLQKQRSLTETRKHWVMLARHIAHVLISDGMSFKMMLQAVQLWSLIAHILDKALVRMRLGRGRDKQQQQQQKQLITNEEIEENKNTKKVINQSTITNADKIFKFIMKPRVTETPIPPPVSEKSNNPKQQSETYTFSKPHRAVIQWMMHAANAMQRRVEKECFSLWEFLTHLRNDVEVVSSGEPQTPWNCVLGYSDNIILRVRSPHLAAQALRTAGFDAVAAITHVWHSSGYTNDKKSNSNGTSKNDDKSGKKNTSDNNNNNNNSNSNSNSSSDSSQWKGDSLTLREVVLLPDCPQCEALAQHILFLPLYPEMKWKNRQKLHSVMQATFPSSLFKSPSEKFIQHVMNTPNRHAYRSTEVNALIASWLQHKGGKETFFADPQPLLLWALLGPVPGYLLSKL